MRNLIRSSSFVVLLFSFSTVVLAQTAQQQESAGARMTASTPDLSGVWFGLSRDFSPKEPPQMQPWAEEKFKSVREGLGPRGKGRGGLAGR